MIFLKKFLKFTYGQYRSKIENLFNIKRKLNTIRLNIIYMNVKNKISFTCDNLMVDRIINRQKAKGYIPKDYRTVMILNCENELINYKDYHEALSKDGIFIVLAYLIFPTFETAKEIKFEPNFEDDFYHNFLITTRKTRYIYLVPESRCPYHYVSPDFFGIKVQIIDDKYQVTFGGLFHDEYPTEFNGSVNIETIVEDYEDEIQKSMKYPEKTIFIPFKDNDDKLDKYSANNLINSKLLDFMREELIFKN